MSSLFSQVPWSIPGLSGAKGAGGSARRVGVVRAAGELRPVPVTLASKLVLPLFIHEGKDDLMISDMPGCSILGWRYGLLDEVYKAMDVGVKSFAIFPKISPRLKTPTGMEALNEDGLLPRSIRLLKEKYPDIKIYTDASLHPYISYGSDGTAKINGFTMNYESLHPLCLQALSQARAGADVISLSDMLDGSIRATRDALNYEGFDSVSIMAYTAKTTAQYCLPSCEDSYLNLRFLEKENYDPETLNHEEMVIKMKKDSSDGAGIIMVMPGLPNLALIKDFRRNSALPIAVYQVSHEYMTVKHVDIQYMDVKRNNVMLTVLKMISSVGARIIFTYFARHAAAMLSGET